jgi:murein tripeptide amidase MpaA
MLNPDGVVLGNYRTGVMGKDLNREYASEQKQLYREIFNVKNMIRNINKFK